jgi:MFS family permease
MLGPVLGGWFTESLSWRWAFWFNIPLGALVITGAALLLRLPHYRAKAPVRVDIAGIATMTVAVTSVVVLASWAGGEYAWSSPVTIALGVVFALASVAFVLVERRAAEPLIPLRLFADRNFTVATVAGLVMAVAMFGTVGYLPTYLQMVAGLGATGSGLMMLTLIAGLGLATVGSGQLVSRTGRYGGLPIVGAATVAVALALLSTLDVDSDLPVIGAYLFLFGAGIGCALQVLVLIVQTSVPASQVGTATGANNFFREIGVSLGSALVGTVFTGRLVMLLHERLPTGTSLGWDPNTVTPERVRQLTEPVRSAVASSYNAALTPVFLYLVPLLVASAIALAFVRAKPLATSVPDPELLAAL